MLFVANIAKNYCTTLKSYRTGKPYASAIIVQLVIPLIVAAVNMFLCIDLRVDIIDTIVIGVSVASILFCVIATMVFHVRIELGKRFNSGKDPFIVENDLKLTDELFSTLLWAMFISLLIVLILIAASWCKVFDGEAATVLHVVSCIVEFLIVHLATVVGTVFKRLQRVYEIVAMEKR